MKQKQFTNKEFQALVIRMLIELGEKKVNTVRIFTQN